MTPTMFVAFPGASLSRSLDQYTGGTTVNNLSFTSLIVYTYVELFVSYEHVFTSTPPNVTLGNVLCHVLGNVRFQIQVNVIVDS